MILNKVEKLIFHAISELNEKMILELDKNIEYSCMNKMELLHELSRLFNKIKSTGLSKLNSKLSKCKYCYPNGKAYSFHNPETDEFIVKYVIFQESEKSFRVEECRNIPPRKDGMPF